MQYVFKRLHLSRQVPFIKRFHSILILPALFIMYFQLRSMFFTVVWLEPERTLREQGVIETTDLTLRNMSFSGSSVDFTNLVQLNLIYIQV